MTECVSTYGGDIWNFSGTKYDHHLRFGIFCREMEADVVRRLMHPHDALCLDTWVSVASRPSYLIKTYTEDSCTFNQHLRSLMCKSLRRQNQRHMSTFIIQGSRDSLPPLNHRHSGTLVWSNTWSDNEKKAERRDRWKMGCTESIASCKLPLHIITMWSRRVDVVDHGRWDKRKTDHEKEGHEWSIYYLLNDSASHSISLWCYMFLSLLSSSQFVSFLNHFSVASTTWSSSHQPTHNHDRNMHLSIRF